MKNSILYEKIPFLEGGWFGYDSNQTESDEGLIVKEVVTFSLWGFQQEQLLSIVTAFLISLCFGFYKKVESVQKIFFHAALCGLISAQVYQVSNKLTANNLWIDLAGVIVGLVGVDYIQSLLKRVLEGAINRFNPKI